MKSPHRSFRKYLQRFTGCMVLLLTTCSYQSLLLLVAANYTSAVAQTTRPKLCAVPGKDGVGGNLTGVINTYYPGSGTANAGATSISVGAPTGGAAIQAGDLLLVIQMQGADIDPSNSDAYGDGVTGGGNNASTLQPPSGGATGASGNLNNANFTAGNYEYVVATGPAAGGTVPIRGAGVNGGLINSYSSAPFSTQGQRTFQVVRVPQYSSASLGAGLTAPAWNGSTGGIVVYDVAGNLDLSGGTLDVSGTGFRGGGGRQLGGGAGLPTDYATSSGNSANGSKGEGTAGTPRFLFTAPNQPALDTGVEGYPGGSNGRGAPGNAGGGSTDGNPGGNEQNSGGGGGANGGSGGLGGRAWNSLQYTGGFGGAGFPATVSRVVLGGGGGAGTTNNATSDSNNPPGTLQNGIASSGASGGGIVLIRTGSVTGSGTINANGGNALNVENDGGGGGGAGGSVVVKANNNNLTGLTVNANGGRGGDAIFFAPDQPENGFHGPGGGGGGGAVFTSPGATVNLAGGASGVAANQERTQESAFGSTIGTTGSVILPGETRGTASGAECLPQLRVNKVTSTPGPLNKPGQATYTITVENTAPTGNTPATDVQISDTLPAGFTFASAQAPVVSGGAAISSVVADSTFPFPYPAPPAASSLATPTAGDRNLVWRNFYIPSGGRVEISFTVNIDASVSDGTYNNPAEASYFDPARTTSGNRTGLPGNTRTPFYDAPNNPGEDVTIGSPPTIRKSVRLLRDNDRSGSLTIGDDVEYSINVTNPSTATPINNLVISDTIPVQVQVLQDGNNAIQFPTGFTAAPTLSSASFNGTGSSVALTSPGTLAPNTTATLRFNARVRPGSASPVTNVASINFAGDGGRPVTSDASDSTRPNEPASGVNPGIPDGNGNINQPNLTPNDPTIFNIVSPVVPNGTKSIRLFTDVDNSGSLTTGDIVEYTITYSNSSQTAVVNFQVSDRINTNQLQFVLGSVSLTTSGSGTSVTLNPNYDGNNDINLTNAGGILPPGGQAVIKFRTTVIAAAGVQISNQASATSNGPTSPSVTDAVAGRGDLPQLLDDGVNQGNLADTGDDDPTLLTVESLAPARVRAVKRVTAVIKADGRRINFNSFVDDPNDTNDTASGWSQLSPVGVLRIDPQLLPVQSGDQIEYTIYFLADGGQTVQNARICDPIPGGTVFSSDSFGTGSGIVLNQAGSVTSRTNANDTDNASFFSPLAPLPANNVCPNQSNPNGAVIVNLGTLSNTTGNNFGFIRFRAKVEEGGN